jgi:ribosome maturation factor RimP
VDVIKRIEEIIEEPMAARGYSVVRIQLTGSIRRILQIMIEREDGVSITVDDCAQVSRMVSVLLDVKDPLKDPYVLEVSSAGLDRPLVKPRDYQRFCGETVVVKTYQPLRGRKKFLGVLSSATEEAATLSLAEVVEGEDADITIPFDAIRAAHLHSEL